MKYLMRTSLIVVVMLLISSLYTNRSLANHDVDHVTVEQINQIADKIFILVKNDKYNEASLLLMTFASEFEKVSEEDFTLSRQQLEMLVWSYSNLENVLSSEAVNQTSAFRQVTEFRLLLDALTTSYQPLWVQKEEVVTNAFANMNNAILENNNEKFQISLNEFLTVYDLIYPALYVDLTTSQLRKIDTHVQYIDKHRTTFANTDNALTYLSQMNSDFNALFAGELEEDDTDPSLIWVMFSVGSIIFASLCFVGWRKYKGEKEEKIKKVKNR